MFSLFHKKQDNHKSKIQSLGKKNLSDFENEDYHVQAMQYPAMESDQSAPPQPDHPYPNFNRFHNNPGSQKGQVANFSAPIQPQAPIQSPRQASEAHVMPNNSAQFQGMMPSSPAPSRPSLEFAQNRPAPAIIQFDQRPVATSQITTSVKPVNTQSTTVQLTQADEQTLAFINSLVQAITGHRIQDLPEAKREEIVISCINALNDYVLDYIETKFGKKEAVRFKAAEEFLDLSVFTKFPNVQVQFQEAFQSFLNLISQRPAISN